MESSPTVHFSEFTSLVVIFLGGSILGLVAILRRFLFVVTVAGAASSTSAAAVAAAGGSGRRRGHWRLWGS